MQRHPWKMTKSLLRAFTRKQKHCTPWETLNLPWSFTIEGTSFRGCRNSSWAFRNVKRPLKIQLVQSKKAKQKLQVKFPPKDVRYGSRQQETVRNEKTERQLLGELYVDKAFLEKLLKDEDLIKSTTKHGITVGDLIQEGLSYLDTRTDFWQQQKPIYARIRDRKLVLKRWTRDQKRKPSEVARYILKSMEDIDMLLTSGCPERSCQKAEQMLKKIHGWSDDEIPNRSELLGNLYSCIGNAHIEMGNMGAALQSHQLDLDVARENDLTDAISRALDNIGRVYARTGHFQEAIDTWEQKIPLVKSNLEKIWLFHEIGRCYLEINKAAEARDYGEKSLACAEEEGDVEWQLNAGVLVAQTQVKLEDFQSAVMHFEKALEKAKRIHNDAAQQAIIIALDEANKGFIKELKEERRLERLREMREFEDEEEEEENLDRDAERKVAVQEQEATVEKQEEEAAEKTAIAEGENEVAGTENEVAGTEGAEQGGSEEGPREAGQEVGETGGQPERTEDSEKEEDPENLSKDIPENLSKDIPG
ncbi:outer dynein arm-docking complex subunit 4 isoform X3 [Sphaerodactylus townsendi]|uniref:outer dynein arm-docking complex subunit 4 isoform X3 n=1 Tax=Sphaerodactylus townsendi TaxID=933632 RepID=UPI00202695DB|nr:outer dynein arm-docking complex subunit 4 isoform X3 [Sphaerodactylus townsendi]XP_048374200.1 outer dynein arm-docking complex subunit 4 isoform X3 [Sphaerodactylus townsendi]